MTPADRRTAIVGATLPLLAERGANVTTRQIAHAAGIAEGTVFRVFADKEELLGACISEAFRTDQVCARIREVPTSNDVETRLTDAGLLFVEHFARLGALMQALATSGYDIRQHHPKEQGHGPAAFFGELAESFGSLLGPVEDRAAVPIDELARMTIGLLMSMRFEPATRDKRARVATRVNALLHGALRAPETTNSWGKNS